MSKNKTCGIYGIRNKKNNKIYVGRTNNFLRRETRHRSDLEKGIDSYHLQCSWNKHGEDAFVWEILEECDESIQVEREAFWIKKLNSGDTKFGFNLRIEKGIDGITSFREESKERCSKWQSGRTLPEDHKKNISNGLTKFYQENEVSIDTRKKLSEANTGKRHTEESKVLISEKIKQNYEKNPEIKEKISDRSKKSWSALTKEERSNRMKKVFESNKGKKQSKETSAKKSESMKRFWEKRRSQNQSENH